MKEILYINHGMGLFDHIDCGGSVRSSLFVCALSKVGHVDVISFIDNEVSNITNCDVVYSQYIESDSCPIGRFRKFLQLFSIINPHLLYPLNKRKNQVVCNQLLKKEYDYIAIRYIPEAVKCGLYEYNDRLIIDNDDNPRDALIMQSRFVRTLRNKFFLRLLSISADFTVKKIFKDVFCCFHSNPFQSTLNKSVLLHNTTICEQSLPDISNETPFRILIVGKYSWMPNKEGVTHFLRAIFPKVLSANPKIELRIVGSIPDVQTTEYWKSVEHVTVCGYVEDLTREYQCARIAIVPIYSGAGSSVKTFEAMKLNRLCISTPQGIRGMQYIKEGQDFLLAENDNSFAKLILDSIQDIELCNRISNSAKCKIEKYYSKDAFMKIVFDTIKSR